MVKQIKYALRHQVELRLAALIGIFVLNLVFGVLGTSKAFGNGLMITAISLSGTALGALVIIYAICDFDLIRSLFSDPKGYHIHLAPVRSWKILLGRFVAIYIYDAVALIVGIVGVLVQSFNFAGYPIGWSMRASALQETVLAVLLLVVGYGIFLLTMFLWGALSRSVFYRFRGRAWLALAAICVVTYLFSLLDLLLWPVAPPEIYGGVIIMQVGVGPNPAYFLSLLLNLIKAGTLFAATTYLMGRKINL